MSAPTAGDGATGPAEPDVEATLAVPFPELDDLLRPFRADLDPVAGIGVPAHVTIVHPFAGAARLDRTDVAWLQELFAGTPAFGCRFARTRWFGEDVLWLEPEPSGPFRRLTAQVAARFPDHPPYGGRFPVVTPHLTLARRVLAGAPASAAAELHRLKAVERRITGLLPLTLAAERVSLMSGGEGVVGWQTELDFPLGSGIA